METLEVKKAFKYLRKIKVRKSLRKKFKYEMDYGTNIVKTEYSHN